MMTGEHWTWTAVLLLLIRNIHASSDVNSVVDGHENRDHQDAASIIVDEIKRRSIEMSSVHEQQVMSMDSDDVHHVHGKVVNSDIEVNTSEAEPNSMKTGSSSNGLMSAKSITISTTTTETSFVSLLDVKSPAFGLTAGHEENERANERRTPEINERKNVDVLTWNSFERRNIGLQEVRKLSSKENENQRIRMDPRNKLKLKSGYNNTIVDMDIKNNSSRVSDVNQTALGSNLIETNKNQNLEPLEQMKYSQHQINIGPVTFESGHSENSVATLSPQEVAILTTVYKRIGSTPSFLEVSDFEDQIIAYNNSEENSITTKLFGAKKIKNLSNYTAILTNNGSDTISSITRNSDQHLTHRAEPTDTPILLKDTSLESLNQNAVHITTPSQSVIMKETGNQTKKSDENEPKKLEKIQEIEPNTVPKAVPNVLTRTGNNSTSISDANVFTSFSNRNSKKVSEIKSQVVILEKNEKKDSTSSISSPTSLNGTVLAGNISTSVSRSSDDDLGQVMKVPNGHLANVTRGDVEQISNSVSKSNGSSLSSKQLPDLERDTKASPSGSEEINLESSPTGTTLQIDYENGHNESDRITPVTVSPAAEASPNGYVQIITRTSKNKSQEMANEVEHAAQDEDNDTAGDSVLPLRQCPEERVIDVNWNLTEAGVLALQACPSPYTGYVYRPCYSSGSWGSSDYTECRLPHLREIQNLVFYHVHKHLVDGLYPLADELSRLVTSGSFPIKSPMDRLDAIDALNAILRAKIKIRMEDENKDVNLIRSLISTADQLLTQTKVTFSIETEKNALISTKTVETIIGLRVLAENVLRALIVSWNEDASKRTTQTVHLNTEHIIMSLTHRTPFGTLIPLLAGFGNGSRTHREGDAPQVTVHLEDFRKLGVGISFVWIKDLGAELNCQKYELISDIVLVSLVPAVSIEVNFEEIPKAEIQIQTKRTLSPNDIVKCGRIRSNREERIWSANECEVIRWNGTSVSCICSEMGAFGVIHQRSVDSSFGRSHSAFRLNRFVIYMSCSFSLILLVVSLLGQVLRIRQETREASFILINLLSSLSSIQVIFLLGGPFHSNSSTHNHQQICSFVAILLHYIHLAAGFLMLSHTIYLYQRLWRPESPYPASVPYPDNESLDHSSFWSCFCCCIRSSQWDIKHYCFFSTVMPAFTVLISFLFNPEGYETRRYCWMSIEGGMVYSFIVPVSMLIMINTVVMLLVLKRFFASKPVTHKIEIEKTQPSLRAGVTLLPFFAVNWFLSVLALEDTATTIFQYIFAITNCVHCILVFLFHLYQRHEVNHFIKKRLFGQTKRHQRSILRLRTSHHYPCRGVRVDIPRLYLGGEPNSNLLPVSSSSSTATSSDPDRSGSIPSDSQPLLMPYSSSSGGQESSYDPSQPSTSKHGLRP